MRNNNGRKLIDDELYFSKKYLKITCYYFPHHKDSQIDISIDS